MGIFGNFLGTKEATFDIGLGRLSFSFLTAARTLFAPDKGGVIATVGDVGYKTKTSTVLSSIQNTISVTGLDLSTDQCYEIIASVARTGLSGTPTIRLYFNADTTAANYRRQSITYSNTVVTSNRNTADNTAGFLASGDDMTLTIRVFKDCNGKAVAYLQGTRAPQGDIIVQISSISWNSTANVTDVTLSISTNNFTSGSYMRAYSITT